MTEPTDRREPEPASGEQQEQTPEAADKPRGDDAEATGAEAEAATDRTKGPEAGAESEPEAGKESEPRPEAPPPTDPRELRIRSLERQLAERDATLREYIRAHKKAEAEFEAFKARMRRDREDDLNAARGRLVERFLDVADNLERSLEATRAGGSLESLRQGVEMVLRQFHQSLEEMGLERYEPTGEPFDPNTMEALGLVPVTDAAQDNRVVLTLKAGFRLGDREIRPALVQVGRKM